MEMSFDNTICLVSLSSHLVYYECSLLMCKIILNVSSVFRFEFWKDGTRGKNAQTLRQKAAQVQKSRVCSLCLTPYWKVWCIRMLMYFILRPWHLLWITRGRHQALICEQRWADKAFGIHRFKCLTRKMLVEAENPDFKNLSLHL